jgi:Flp pilus assembly protein TadG
MLNFLTQRNRSLRRQRGMQLVEAAFIMPVMLMLLGAIGEFGRYFHMRSTLLRATMTSVRYMSDKTNSSTELQNAKNMAVCGKITTCAASESVYPGFSDTNVSVSITGDNTVGKYVTVSTTGINFAPVFSVTKLTGSAKTWTSPPITVSTKMRYTGS